MKQTIAVNARTVLACWQLCHHRVVKPFLNEILQPKRWAAGPHFTYCFLITKKLTTGIDIPLESSLSYFLVIQVLNEIMHFYIFYRQLSPLPYYKREGVFTSEQYHLGCSISIKMASQPCCGTIANKST